MTCEVDMETRYDDHEECYFERINVKLAWDTGNNSVATCDLRSGSA